MKEINLSQSSLENFVKSKEYLSNILYYTCKKVMIWLNVDRKYLW